MPGRHDWQCFPLKTWPAQKHTTLCFLPSLLASLPFPPYFCYLRVVSLSKVSAGKHPFMLCVPRNYGQWVPQVAPEGRASGWDVGAGFPICLKAIEAPLLVAKIGSYVTYSDVTISLCVCVGSYVLFLFDKFDMLQFINLRCTTCYFDTFMYCNMIAIESNAYHSTSL